jgi:hypothetical protein
VLQSVSGRGASLEFGNGLGLSASFTGFGVHTLIILACQPCGKRLARKSNS